LRGEYLTFKSIKFICISIHTYICKHTHVVLSAMDEWLGEIFVFIRRKLFLEKFKTTGRPGLVQITCFTIDSFVILPVWEIQEFSFRCEASWGLKLSFTWRERNWFSSCYGFLLWS
jgi:hypothetical protein